MREFADVHTRPKPVDGAEETDETEINVGLSLIQAGLGWYDGMEFEGAAVFKQAELDAKEKRIGFWVEDNPIPPWDFEEH